MVALRALVRPTLGMSLPDAALLEAFSLVELQEVVGRLFGAWFRVRPLLGYTGRAETAGLRGRILAGRVFCAGGDQPPPDQARWG